eukprot:1156351-Pelagomonas_calceolata.AAC.13
MGSGGLLGTHPAPGPGCENTPCGNKLVGILNRMGMKLASKFDGTLVVRSQKFELVKAMLSIMSPIDAQKNDA